MINEYVIKAEGLVRRTITEQPLDLTTAIVDQISAGVARKCTYLFPMKMVDPDNSWNASAVFGAGNITTWSLPLQKITLNTFFQSKDGTVFPVFDDTTSPKLSLEWKVPDSMYLVLGVVLDQYRSCLNQYLVAFDSGNRAYRLPLSNLCADCKLCFGKYKSEASTHIEALTLAVTQFHKGDWNKDLYETDGEKRKRTRQMFSFKVEDKAFPQINPENWVSLSEKVANDFITNNIINPYLF